MTAPAAPAAALRTSGVRARSSTGRSRMHPGQVPSDRVSPDQTPPVQIPPDHGDRGAVTVEAAIGIGSVLAVFLLGLAAIGVLLGQLRCTGAAVDAAARGLDVKQLKLVINYDAPNHMEDYVHRAGRTGRAGNKGTCVTFITPEQDRYSVDIYRALKASNAAVPKELEDLANGQFSLQHLFIARD